jgi:thiol-disulfide isomerase/thioredoxin
MTNGIRGSVAPELVVSYWIDAAGRTRARLTLKDLRSGHRILFFYQHWCPGCHSHEFPTLIELIAHAAPLDVGFAVVQTVFEGFDVNTADQLSLDQQRYGMSVPFGHDPISPAGQYPTTMVNYRTGGTPWFVAIDPEGTVIGNGLSLDVNKLLSIFRNRS